MDRSSTPRLVLDAAGWILVGSGLFHVAVWIVAGGDWEGPLSWRKPILFGFSAGSTALSLGWLWSWWPPPRSRPAASAATLTAIALLAEVALIDLQCWRGRASHFNDATPLDGAIADGMNLLIAAVTLFAVWLTLRFLRGSPQRDGVAMDDAMLLAARAGLILLVWSCALGFWATWHGERQIAAGRPPELLGAAGVTKFAHGAVIHALQWLPAIAWFAARRGLPGAARLRLVRLGVAASVLVGLASWIQVLLGRARLDLAPATAALFLGAIVCGLAILVGLVPRRSAAESAGDGVGGVP